MPSVDLIILEASRAKGSLHAGRFSATPMKSSSPNWEISVQLFHKPRRLLMRSRGSSVSFTCQRQPSQRLKIFDGGYFARNKPSLKDFLQHSPHCMRGFSVLTIKLWSGTTTEYQILTMPPPDTYRWERKEDEWQPVITQLSPVPEAIVQLVIKCNCVKERCSNNL